MTREEELAAGYNNPVEDWQRCVLCGLQQCICHDGSQPQQQNRIMNNIPIATIENYPDGASVESVSGILKYVNDVKTGITQSGKMKGQPWYLQGFVLVDDNQDEIPGTIGCEKHLLDTALKGSRATFSCYSGQRGMSGVKVKVESYNKDGEEITVKKLRITDTANVSIDGVEQKPGSKTKPKQQAGSGSPAPAASQPQQRMTNDTSTVTERVSAYFDVFAVVQDEAKKRGIDLPLPEIKDITTGMCMSYRGQYGVYFPPVFANAKPATEKAEKAKPTAPDVVTTWKDFVHPKRNKKLGDMDIPEISKLIDWALTAEPTAAEAQKLKGALLMASASLNCGAWEVLSMKLADEGIEDSSAIIYFKSIFQKEGPLNAEESISLLKDWKATLENLKEIQARDEGPVGDFAPDGDDDIPD